MHISCTQYMPNVCCQRVCLIIRACARARKSVRQGVCAHYTDSASMHTRTLPVSCGQAEKRGRTKMKHRDIARAPVLCAL